jgi:(p)ppGpp synthase/HD superfamily hydrolase
MSTLDRAVQIASKAHEGQTDKDGQPYILHPLAVMARVDGLTAKIVAVLHDVVEDTSVTMDDLRRAGFGPDVLEPLALVTHAKSEPYAEYVIRAKANPIARAVKIADLTENSRIERALMRCATLERDAWRMQRYLLSYKFLMDQLGEADYRQAVKACGEFD